MRHQYILYIILNQRDIQKLSRYPPKSGYYLELKLWRQKPSLKKLVDRVRDAIRVKQYLSKTEQSYVNWIIRYILDRNKRHPQQIGSKEIEEFITPYHSPVLTFSIKVSKYSGVRRYNG